MLHPNYLTRTLLRVFSTLLLITTAASAGPSPSHDLYFEPNSGQAARPIGWLARTTDASLAFTHNGLEIWFAGARRSVVLKWKGASPAARFEALDRSPDSTSYYLGADPSRWVLNVPHYGRLACRGIYPGIDAIFYWREGRLEYDLVVAPGADPSAIQLAFEATTGITIEGSGNLVVHAGEASFKMHKPRLFQRLRSGRETDVVGGYRLMPSGLVMFDIGAFDRSRTLVVDPVLTFANYIGGENDDSVVAVTSQGDIVGVTASLAFGEASLRGGAGRLRDAQRRWWPAIVHIRRFG